MTFAVSAELSNLMDHLLSCLVHASTLQSQLVQLLQWQFVCLLALYHALGILRCHLVTQNLLEYLYEKLASAKD